MFAGLAEDYPAWSTKFMAYMQTKGLYKSLLDKEVLMPEVTPPKQPQPMKEQNGQLK